MKIGPSRWIAQCLVGLLLFAQMVLAAYACTGLSGATGSSSVGPVQQAASAASESLASGASAVDCHGPIVGSEAGTANLCAEHCKYGQQSDQVNVVAPPAAALLERYRLAALPAHYDVRYGPEYMDGRGVAAPPHAILHCVFRT